MRENDLHSISNFLAGVREELAPISDGQIRRGHAGKGDLSLEPGLRKTTLKDARKISDAVMPKPSRAANALEELDRISRDPAQPIGKCPSCGLPMLLDEQYVRFAVGASPIHMISVKLRAQWCSHPECKTEVVAIIPGKTGRL